MMDTEAFLEIKLDLSEPVEIADFAAFFAGLGAEFERYISSYPKEVSLVNIWFHVFGAFAT